MLFIEVSKTEELDALKVNGVLGLSPGSTQISTSSSKKETNSFIESLYKLKKIEERVFSLYISDEANFRNTSMFTAGGYDVDRFAYNQTLTWNPLISTDYWTVKLKKVNVGDLLLITSTKNAIIDSGTSYMAMPDLEFKNLISTVEDEYGYKCSYDSFNSLYACDCTRE